MAKPDLEFWKLNNLFHRFWCYAAALESLLKEVYENFV